MDAQKVTQEQMQEAAKKYGALVYTQAQMFTEDDWKAAKVQQQVLWEIPVILTKPTDQFSHVMQIIQHVRTVSLALLKEDPLYDQWELWKQEPFHFCFLKNDHPAFHKEIFWYRSFRDIPVQEVAQKYGISSDEVKQIISEMAHEVKTGLNRYIENEPLTRLNDDLN